MFCFDKTLLLWDKIWVKKWFFSNRKSFFRCIFNGSGSAGFDIQLGSDRNDDLQVFTLLIKCGVWSGPSELNYQEIPLEKVIDKRIDYQLMPSWTFQPSSSSSSSPPSSSSMLSLLKLDFLINSFSPSYFPKKIRQTERRKTKKV